MVIFVMLIPQTCHRWTTLSPRFAPYQTSQRLFHSSDTSTPLFTLYLQIAEDYSAKILKVLEKDTDQILVFVSPCVGYD